MTESSKNRESSELNLLFKQVTSEIEMNLQNLINAGAEITQQTLEEMSLQSQYLLEKTLTETGQSLTDIAENPLFKSLTQFWGTDWLKAILGEVKIEPLQKEVWEIQTKYPTEMPQEIAHRIMVSKAIQAASMGLVTNVIPPIAAALFAIDLVTTTRLQTEMIYQIAAAYQLDLNDPARRGEVLAIFGLSLGGSTALKMGLGLIEIIPGLGLVVGASSNAVLLYTLGHAACQFYETKLHPERLQLTSEQFSQAQANYLQSALEQEKIMDQILVHLILARYPDKSWSDIVPELQKYNLSSHSITFISQQIEQPKSLNQLIKQLQPDFAAPLLAQCRKITQTEDRVISMEEQKILDAIANRVN